MRPSETDDDRAGNDGGDHSLYDTNLVIFPEPSRWANDKIATPVPDLMPDTSNLPDLTPTACDLLLAMKSLTEGSDQLTQFLDERLEAADADRHKWLRILFIHLVLYAEKAQLPQTERSLVNTLETLIAETGV